MAEVKEQVRRRRRRVESTAMLKVTIERAAIVMKPTKIWNRLHDDPVQGQYGYVDETLPQLERVTLLEQSLPENKVDLAKVIKAINGL